MRRALAAALLLCLSSTVVRADHPFSWTGLYIGAHGGWATGGWDGTLTYDPGTGPLAGVFDPAGRSITAEGWLGGGQIGFNVQSGAFVLGIEVDGAWTNLSDEETFTSKDGLGDYRQM